MHAQRDTIMKSTRTRILSVVATAAVLTLTACSNGADPTVDPTSSASPTESGSPSASPTDGASDDATPTETPTLEVDASTGKTNFCEEQQDAAYTGSAVKTFGEERVKDAYCEMGDLMISQSFISQLVRAPYGTKFDPRSFDVPREYMSEDALKVWDAAVARVSAGNPTDADYGDVWAFMYFSLQNPDYEHYPAGSTEPSVLNLAVSPARTGVETRGEVDRLLMRLTVDGDVNLLRKKDDKPYLIPISKEISLYLVDAGGDVSDPHNWFIDGWESKATVGQPRPRTEISPDDASSE